MTKWFMLFLAVLVGAAIYWLIDWQSKHEDGE